MAGAGIIHCVNIQTRKQVTRADGATALRMLPLGSGVTAHGVLDILDSGNVIILCAHLSPNTIAMRDKADNLMKQALDRATADNNTLVDRIADLPGPGSVFLRGVSGQGGFLADLQKASKLIFFVALAILGVVVFQTIRR